MMITEVGNHRQSLKGGATKVLDSPFSVEWHPLVEINLLKWPMASSERLETALLAPYWCRLSLTANETRGLLSRIEAQ
jgi:hypothetical protein